MRDGLARLKGKRKWFTATVGRYGADCDGNPTVCLVDIYQEDKLVADHCWVPLNQAKGGIVGKVSFFAKVSRYIKPSESIFEEPVVSYKLTDIKHYRKLK